MGSLSKLLHPCPKKIAMVFDGKEVSILPFVHVISGYDITSYSYMKWKDTALNAMMSSNVIDKLFCVCEQLENVSEVA